MISVDCTRVSRCKGRCGDVVTFRLKLLLYTSITQTSKLSANVESNQNHENVLVTEIVSVHFFRFRSFAL